MVVLGVSVEEFVEEGTSEEGEEGEEGPAKDTVLRSSVLVRDEILPYLLGILYEEVKAVVPVDVEDTEEEVDDDETRFFANPVCC